MLQFIVLGQIPGTSLQLDFNDVLRLAGIFLLVIILSIELNRFKFHRRQRQLLLQPQS